MAKKKEVVAQELRFKEVELAASKEETVRLKKKLAAVRAEMNRKVGEMENKLIAKNGELEDLRLQFSEGEYEKLLRKMEKKEALVRELRAENLKLNELKSHYETILEKCEEEAKELRRKNEELDKGEEVRAVKKELDVLKMKVLFYEGRQEKVQLGELREQVDGLEKRLREERKREAEEEEEGEDLGILKGSRHCR